MTERKFISAQEAGFNYNTTIFETTEKNRGWSVGIKGRLHEYVGGPAKGRTEIRFELRIRNEERDHTFELAKVIPNSVHDKKRLDTRTFEKWTKKVINHMDNDILAQMILMRERGETNPLMCSDPYGCTYYGLDNLINRPVEFHFNSDYTTHDISEIKKRALRKYM